MAIEVHELEESRAYADSEDRRADRGTRQYFASGSDNEKEVIEAVTAFAPVNIDRPGNRAARGPLQFNGVSLRNIQVNDAFMATVTYLDPGRIEDKYDLGGINTVWDTGNEQITLYQGIAEGGWPKNVLAKPPNPAEATIHVGATPNDSGGSPDGLPEGMPNVLDFKDGRGVDVPVGEVNMRERHIFGANFIDLEYMREVASLVGKINNQPFRGTEAGESLFLGANARQPGAGDAPWEIDFQFLIKRNQVFVEVFFETYQTGPSPSQITDNSVVFEEIGGHDYVQVWTRKKLKEVTLNIGNSGANGSPTPVTKKIPMPQVIAAFVHKIYEPDDFSKLGIGVN